jgi:hypothetical protein
VEADGLFDLEGDCEEFFVGEDLESALEGGGKNVADLQRSS